MGARMCLYPVASKVLSKVIRTIRSVQQFPVMTNYGAVCLVQEINLSLERNSVETNLLRYPERTVSSSIISSIFFLVQL